MHTQNSMFSSHLPSILFCHILPFSPQLFSFQVVEVSTSKTGKHGHAKCHFVAIDIFNGKKLEDIVPSSHNCDVISLSLTYCALLIQVLIFVRLKNFACIPCITIPLQVPHVNRTDYQLIDISEDGFVSFNYIFT